MGILQVDCWMAENVKVIHVKIILHALQVTPLIAKICLKDSKNTGRKWSMC